MSVFLFVAVARLNVVQIMHRGLICFFRLSMFSLPRLICIYGGTKARLVWCSSLKCKLERDNLREPCLQNSNANFGIKKVSIACRKNKTNLIHMGNRNSGSHHKYRMRTRNKNRRTVKERNNPTDAFCDIHSDEKLTVETSAGETLLSVQFTLSTQIKSNCLVIPPPAK